LPYLLSNRAGLRIIRMPPLTPYLGAWLDYSGCSQKRVCRHDFETEVLSELISQLPRATWYHQVHPPQLQNWLPFHWKGYRQSTRYTYLLEEKDEEATWRGLEDIVRNKIRKAEKEGIRVGEESDLAFLRQVCRSTFGHQGLASPFELPLLDGLHAAISSRRQGQILVARDAAGAVHAALYLVWDQDAAYCWIMGADTRLRRSGAVQFLLWQAIRQAISMGKTFNFEGSMLPQIEPVFRAFGGERRPVHQIFKASNRLLDALFTLLR
ncbi:MAG: hypothetical protein RI973_1797, partial [Bacteroidota bacterium]